MIYVNNIVFNQTKHTTSDESKVREQKNEISVDVFPVEIVYDASFLYSLAWSVPPDAGGAKSSIFLFLKPSLVTNLEKSFPIYIEDTLHYK